MPESQVLNYNEANVQKQKELQIAHKAKPQKKKKAKKTCKLESGVKDSDSRASTPLADNSTAVKIKGGPASTPSSSQVSSSDVPLKKRGQLDATVETTCFYNTIIPTRDK